MSSCDDEEPKYRDEGWLREQYVEQRRSTKDIADECGCAGTTISDWLNRHGIEARSRGSYAITDQRLTDRDWLREQYSEEGMTCAEIADECGCRASAVSSWLNKHDIGTRVGKPPSADQRLTDRDWLREQYIEKNQSTIEISNECGCGHATVLRYLKKYDIETRDRSESNIEIQQLTDADWLREQYVEKQREREEIAEECGCHPSTVTNWAVEHGLEEQSTRPHYTTPKQLRDAEWLQEKYVEKQRSTIEIAEECNCSGSTVLKWLNEHGIETRDRVQTGENHPRWNGGRVDYGPGWNQNKRGEVRERDNYTCQDPRCSITQSEHIEKCGRKLDVHHLRKARDIANPEDRNAKENLITLCMSCHARWEKIADAGLVPEVVGDDTAEASD